MLFAKEQARSESAGGLKVKTLGWTPWDVGSSPSQHSNFSLLKYLLREKINYLLIKICIKHEKISLYAMINQSKAVTYFHW